MYIHIYIHTHIRTDRYIGSHFCSVCFSRGTDLSWKKKIHVLKWSVGRGRANGLKQKGQRKIFAYLPLSTSQDRQTEVGKIRPVKEGRKQP